jgi:hypothetical protein
MAACTACVLPTDFAMAVHLQYIAVHLQYILHVYCQWAVHLQYKRSISAVHTAMAAHTAERYGLSLR